MSLPYVVRPLEPWTEPVTQQRLRHPFRANVKSPGGWTNPVPVPWSDTLDLLDRELFMLGARSWVLQIDVAERQIRRDGGIRADATPTSPAVRVCFESRHGPLRYACDRFTDWQANVRAVALALEALRKVERYGVGGRGEQYRGWTAISSRPHEIMTRAEAAEFIAHWAAQEMTGLTAELILREPAVLKSAYRAAARATHPDHHPDQTDTFTRLNAARDLLTREVR